MLEGSTIVCSSLSIIVSFLWILTLHNLFPKTSLKAHQAKLHKLLGVLLTICKDYDVDIWGAFGTFLGAVRNGDIIPWDDDIDMEMVSTDYDKLVRNAEDIQKKYGVQILDPLWNSVNILKVRFENDNSTIIDVFRSSINESTGHLSVDSPFETYHHKGGKPKLRTIKFGRQKIPVPTSTEVLAREYGSSWRIPKKRFSHLYWIGNVPPLCSVVLPSFLFLGLIIIIGLFAGLRGWGILLGIGVSLYLYSLVFCYYYYSCKYLPSFCVMYGS